MFDCRLAIATEATRSLPAIRLPSTSQLLVILTMKRIVLSVAVICATSLSLTAGPEVLPSDKSVVATETRDLCDWTGFYLGGDVGYAFEANADVSVDLTGEWELFQEPSDETFAEGLGTRDLNTDGIAAGLFVGYNSMMGNLLVGLEAQFK